MKFNPISAIAILTLSFSATSLTTEQDKAHNCTPVPYYNAQRLLTSVCRENLKIVLYNNMPIWDQPGRARVLLPSGEFITLYIDYNGVDSEFRKYGKVYNLNYLFYLKS